MVRTDIFAVGPVRKSGPLQSFFQTLGLRMESVQNGNIVETVMVSLVFILRPSAIDREIACSTEQAFDPAHDHLRLVLLALEGENLNGQPSFQSRAQLAREVPGIGRDDALRRLQNGGLRSIVFR